MKGTTMGLVEEKFEADTLSEDQVNAMILELQGETPLSQSLLSIYDCAERCDSCHGENREAALRGAMKTPPQAAECEEGSQKTKPKK
jgi:hypothetical protein